MQFLIICAQSLHLSSVVSAERRFVDIVADRADLWKLAIPEVGADVLLSAQGNRG